MENIIDLLIEKTLSEIVGWIVPFVLGGVLTYIKRGDVAKYLKNIKIHVYDRGISLQILISSIGFSGDSDDVLNSLERKFRSFRFKKTGVTKSVSPEKDKYVLSNFEIDPIRSVEILLVSVPSDDSKELIVQQIKVMINAKISQHDNDKHFDTLRELVGQVKKILGFEFSSEYAFVIKIPEDKAFMKFEGVRGYKFKCIDVVREGKSIRIADQQMVVYSEFDNAVQNLINELSLITS